MANILVVDDSGVMRKKIGMLLKEMGHIVIAEAKSGLEAVRSYARFNPDLVTMDIVMPGVDGIEAVKRIMQSYPDAKIVMVSSLGQEDKVKDALRYGAKHFIIKPFTVEQAQKIINIVLALEAKKV